MKILKLLEAVQALNEMNRAELNAISNAIVNIAKTNYQLPFKFSHHIVNDRFVSGNRTHVTAIDVFNTVKWGLTHPQFNSIVDNVKNSQEDSESTVRLDNVFNKLSIVLAITKDGIVAITGDYANWENSQSYRQDAVIRVPKDAWTSEEFVEERKKASKNNAAKRR